MQPTNDHMDERFGLTDSERKARADASLWPMAGTLYRYRKFLVGISFGVAIVAAVITLLVPNWYRASATVLMPESAGGGISSMLFKNLPSAASSILGGSSGDYVRYMAILQSRTVMLSAVDSFDLVGVYDLADAKNPRSEAMEMLAGNTEIELDIELDYLSISVNDEDPQRAASLANFLVRRLNYVNSRLSAQNAANYRAYIERRYLQARADMDSLLNATADFQREYGVFDLPTQTASFFDQVADMRSKALEAEIQRDALLSQFGPNNPQVETFAAVARAANSRYQDALEGRERLLPIPKSAVPDVGRRYVDLELERTIQTAILEIVGPLYEQARLQEEQQMQAVQVLDDAIPPARKAGPKRTIIVAMSALSAFILSVLCVLLMTWWRDRHAYFARRLQIASESARRAEASTAST